MSWFCFVIKSSCFVDFIYHKPKDCIVFYIYDMREVNRNVLLFIYENIFMIMENELNLN